MSNVFQNIPLDLSKEVIENLLVTNKFIIERIISRGHTSSENYWYDQDTNEFVILLSGKAEIEFESDELKKLEPGDWLVIPAHEKHRVSWTTPDENSVWLAVHY